MFKKSITISMILLAALFLASACSAVNTEEPYEDTEEPVETNLPLETNEPVVADDTSPVCASQLDTLFNSEGESDALNDAPEADDEYILVTYQVSGDEISSPKLESGVPDEFVSYQEDTASQENIWQFVTDVIPADQREILGEFIIFTDGVDNTIAAVDEADTGGKWTIEMDIVDSQDQATMSTALVHEFGHMLTLNDTQIDANASSCSTYNTIDGCSRSDSYINAFYNAFWADIYDEWSSTVEFSDGEVNEDQVAVFYEQYPEQFVTDYAPTGPEEDIAESFLYFVFSSRPAGDTLAEQKILFFYDYPELVALRGTMRSNLCQYIQE